VPQAQWIGPRPAGLQIGMIMFVGTIGIVISPFMVPMLIEADPSRRADTRPRAA